MPSPFSRTTKKISTLRSKPIHPSATAKAYVAVDTETTGLSSDARLVELAAIRYENGKEVDRFVTLIDPGVSIPYEATAIHGITNAMVRGKPKAKEVLRKFQDLLDGAVFVAHNASFDLRMINGELRRAGLPLLTCNHVCTRNLARRHLQELFNYKLSTVARELRVTNKERAHRALGDALTVGDIFHKLMGKANVEIPATKRAPVASRTGTARQKTTTKPRSAVVRTSSSKPRGSRSKSRTATTTTRQRTSRSTRTKRTTTG